MPVRVVIIQCAVPNFFIRDALVGRVSFNAHGDGFADHQSVHVACIRWDVSLVALLAVVNCKDMGIARLPFQTLRVSHEDIDLNAISRTEGHCEAVNIKSIICCGVVRGLTYSIAVRYRRHRHRWSARGRRLTGWVGARLV